MLYAAHSMPRRAPYILSPTAQRLRFALGGGPHLLGALGSMTYAFNSSDHLAPQLTHD